MHGGKRKTTVYLLAVLMIVWMSVLSPAIGERLVSPHVPLAQDGVHDPKAPAIGYLQAPAKALDGLPPAASGDFVDWSKALAQRLIEPRSSLDAVASGNRVIDMDVVMTDTGSMPAVKFPHRAHTEWSGCAECHSVFVPKKAANPITMFAILRGEYCGVCHGKVAFPTSECFRCHSIALDPRRLRR